MCHETVLPKGAVVKVHVRLSIVDAEFGSLLKYFRFIIIGSMSVHGLFRPTVRRAFGKRGGQVSASDAAEVYRRRFVATRLAVALLADWVPCFAIFACPALVMERDCSYISIHFSLEIAEISLPIASSGKSSGDSK
jgi:hypothetical protein